MKNIHLIPTDKPSRLFIIYGRLYNYHKPQQGNGINQINYHIYITSDQEPKEGDWVFDTFRNAYPIIRQLKTEEEVLGVQETEFKIILTTDPDLIKDSVQAIDDEFLEWFVKNPSCEEVDVMTDTFTVKEMSMLPLGTRNLKYKIIIPQEKPKQETLEEVKNGTIIQFLCGSHSYDGVWFGDNHPYREGNFWWRSILQEQDKNKYSEEELHNAFYNGWIYRGEDYSFPKAKKEWFEQFKKK